MQATYYFRYLLGLLSQVSCGHYINPILRQKYYIMNNIFYKGKNIRNTIIVRVVKKFEFPLHVQSKSKKIIYPKQRIHFYWILMRSQWFEIGELSFHTTKFYKMPFYKNIRRNFFPRVMSALMWYCLIENDHFSTMVQ